MEKEKGEAAVDKADLFKEAFKRYKKKEADLSDVIDFTKPSKYDNKDLVRVCEPVTVGTTDAVAQVGLIPPDQWKIYTLSSTPGLLVIPNPFQNGRQHYWVQRCLVDYPCRPNVCNLDAHITREKTGQLWPEDGDWSENDLIYKLRWVTLGYHYDWNTKEYYDDRKSDFPSDLAKLSTTILEVAGFPKFLAEAAIVNFYHLDSTLSGHTDHSERDLSLPLLSISFGQSAVFLVGGETKSVYPQAIMLHSGDIVIMSGASRLAYHGVPKIIAPATVTNTTPIPLRRDCLVEYTQPASCSRTQQSLSEQKAERSQVCREQRRPECKKAVETRKYSTELEQGVCSSSHPQHQLMSGRDLEQSKNEGGTVLERYSNSEQEVASTAHLSEVLPAKRARIEQHREHSTSFSTDCTHNLFEQWSDFERYISTSRININIRQVNSDIYTGHMTVT